MCNNMCQVGGFLRHPKGEDVATNLAIDARILEEALKVGGLKTKKDTVNQALREFILRREQSRITGIFGQIDYDKSYDYKKHRAPR